MVNVFSVDLFYGDIGFTDDYSNVLQFPTESARDTYFDNLEHITVQNTNVNRINISGNSVKFAFTSETDIGNLEKFNYIRINTTLFGMGENVGLPVLKKEYGFIDDFDVISSDENVTVVEFTFNVDIWQNYQFDFELKECNVERSHMDRWNTNGTIKYNTPSYDAIDCYMKEERVTEMDNEGIYYQPGETVTSQIGYCVMAYLVDPEDVIDIGSLGVTHESLKFLYFPVDLVNLSNRIPYAVINVIDGTTVNPPLVVNYPSLNDVINGTYISLLNLNGARVKNANIIYDSSMKIVYSLKNETWRIGNYQFVVNGWFNEVADANNTIHCVRRYNIISDIVNIKNVCLATEDGYENPWHIDKQIVISIKQPVKPIDNADYNPQYEVMLYKNPVRSRYITSYDGASFNQIPDIAINFTGNNYIKLTSVISYASMYNILRVNIDNIASANVIADAFISEGIACDILTNAWENYVMTTRNADRQAMWLKIATAGLADMGSTGISAGIGYRANSERADMANIRRSMVDGRTKYGRSLKTEANMYRKYAMQAAAMSAGGGVLQYGAGALGAYFGQEIKETAIKNTPGTLNKTGDIAGLAYIKPKSNIKLVETICDDISYEKYKNIFKKFGYAICGVITPDIMSRKYFNYIKTNGAILTGSANQAILTSLAMLFDKGMTIWHMDYTTRQTLYTYDKENIERSLM